MTIYSALRRQSFGYTAAACREHEFSKDWFGVILDESKPDGEQELWRGEKSTPNLFAAIHDAEHQAEEMRKEAKAAFERLTSGDSAESIAARLLGRDRKPNEG